eukprot:TRINITY_DN21580_c0_g3_i1.p1 TRINITY_DN21580_c0_g3~~TRINITY_DN21580_c0_g3_i1.p1  ORF type:complete len:1443 (+),score=619.87 TRINITY_DN21580_c0_g3_i1:178-4506(+)
MSLYFIFKTRSDWKSTVVTSEWSKTAPSIAISTSEPGGTGRVSIYRDEGDLVGDVQLPAAEGSLPPVAECATWHPEQNKLCVGWRDGSMALWSEEDGVREITSVHRGKNITLMRWSDNGTRLITGDAHGTWQIWKYDGKNLSAATSNKDKDPFDGSLTHSVFRTVNRPTTSVHAGGGDDPSDAAHKLMIEDEEDMGDYHGGAYSVTKLNDQCAWFLGGTSGNVWGIDDEGNHGVIFNLDNQPITCLLYHTTKAGIVAMNQGCSVSYYLLMDDNRWVQHARFKLSFSKVANVSSAQMIWVGPGLLATAAHEAMIRVWNIDANENYVIHVEDHPERKTPERLACLCFNPKTRVLCGGTQSGRCIMWQYSGPESSMTEDDWTVSSKVNTDGCVTGVSWGPMENLLSAIVPDSVLILHGSALKRQLYKSIVAVQQSPEAVYYEDLGMKVQHNVQCQIRVKDVVVAGSHIAVWNSTKVELLHVQMSQVSSVGIIEVENVAVALHPDKVMVARTERGVSAIQFYNLQLQKVSHLSIKAHEGEIVQLVCTNDYLAVVTSKHFLTCWWIGGRAGEEKLHGYSRQLWEGSAKVLEAMSLNCTGSQVAIIAKNPDTPSATTVYVCDLEHDRVGSFDFEELNRSPTAVFWDQTEPKLLSCETVFLRNTQAEAEEAAQKDAPDPSSVEVITLFSSERGLKLQDRFFLDKSYSALIGLSVPNFYFFRREPVEREDIVAMTQVALKVMRDFEGIDCTDPRVKEALLDFSYNLACGDMDAAYRSVKLIKDENVWTNMAQMCVKTGRLDVAEVCLGNMQDAKGAAALREAKNEPESEAHTAMLALQLGLLDDAEELYKKCGRYDLLNIMHQACGRWDEAISTAEQHDRIHLRTIHYRYARHLESLGEVQRAIAQYELARCNGYEVPRMLYDAGMLDELEQYAGRSNEKAVFTWWAQYCESNERYDQAFHFYKEAGDIFSRARLHCYLKDLDAAAVLVQSPENSKDSAAAAYHLARHFEEAGKLKEALQFYKTAKAYKNAIRIARTNNMAGEVMQLSLQADQATLIESAEWFEEQGVLPKAVILYKKAGELAKAIDLCVRGSHFDTLQKLADDLDKDTDPDVFIQCAEYFVSKDQHEKAVRMYIQARGYSEALQVCLDHDVKLTEDMAEEMTLPKTDNEDDEALRLSLLRKVAKVAKVQESWHLACKKYTQAGDRIKGMKVLLKSGDTDKIVFFTNHSRQKDVYILAAHYLQTIDWHNNSTITKHIINFYTKARAYESLSGFYDAIAQVYIDEFRDYDKALGALQDAAKYMEKSKANNRDMKMQQLETKVSYVERFVEARNMVKTDPAKMVESCRQLLDVEDIEGAVRVGDIFALLVEFYTGRQEYDQAYQLIEQMRDRQIVLPLYLESQLVQAVYNAMGVEYVEQETAQQSHHATAPPEELPDAIDEEIPNDEEPVDD